MKINPNDKTPDWPFTSDQTGRTGRGMLSKTQRRYL